jgi:Do/DeqQ family serine protease
MRISVTLLAVLTCATPAWSQPRTEPAPAARPAPGAPAKPDASRPGAKSPEAKPPAASRAPRAESKVDPRAVLRAMEDAFSTVADRVTPSVVNVSTVPRKRAGGGEEGERFREFFGEEFYERFFQRRPREDTRASGSGVIVDPKGYILTNNHVIENAAEIIVRLSDQRKFTARLVGRDPKTDLAVLKVEAPAPLVAAELGDSDRLRVGQWVIAIGNPFGLDRTVTVGIVSATARNRVGVATYENFIQTDASINPGNSGGPLLNLDGKVVGVNTAIVAAGQGIGFSIPINEARNVMAQLIARGRVVRGWLGVVIQDVTDELAVTFGVKERQGVLVADVMKGGPAEAGGLKAGDVVVEFGGHRIREVPDLQRRVAAIAPGQAVKVVVVRDGKRVPVSLSVGEMPSDEPSPAADEPATEGFGLTVEPLTAGAAARLGLGFTRGLLIIDVAAGGPADRAGLRRGDVVLEIDRQPVQDLAGLAKALARVKPGESVLVYVHRPGGGAGRNQYAVLERAPAP